MRALTIRQPCASLVVAGFKAVENRTRAWPTTVLLPARIAIHAGKGTHDGCWPTALAVVGAQVAEHPALADPLPAGAIVGYVTVVDSHHADECRTMTQPVAAAPEHHEVRFCSPWAMPGMHHWRLAEPEYLPEPILCRGRLGLWHLPQELTP